MSMVMKDGRRRSPVAIVTMVLLLSGFSIASSGVVGLYVGKTFDGQHDGGSRGLRAHHGACQRSQRVIVSHCPPRLHSAGAPSRLLDDRLEPSRGRSGQRGDRAVAQHARACQQRHALRQLINIIPSQADSGGAGNGE